MTRPGPRNLITDVGGLAVGNASDTALKSGVTVVVGEAPIVAAVDIRGGAPGTRETDLLAPGRLVDRVDAIVLSGGSAFGLDAASGVVSALRAQGRGYAVGGATVPIVPAAILFDLANGGRKDWSENPYPPLGAAAFAAAGREFPLGRVGAGFGAMTATHMGGLGSTSLATATGATVGALVAVNAFGSVFGSDDRFLAGTMEMDGEFGGLGASVAPVRVDATPRKPGASHGRANTTIAVVATDAALDPAATRRLAEVAHDGMARAIQPCHTPFDGDLVFGVSTSAAGIEARDPAVRSALEQAAAHCLARAIARAVYCARPCPGDLLPSWDQAAG